MPQPPPKDVKEIQELLPNPNQATTVVLCHLRNRVSEKRFAGAQLYEDGLEVGWCVNWWKCTESDGAL